MSISGNDLRFAKSTGINGNVVSTLEDYWYRSSEWLALPAVDPTEQKLVGLFAVFDTPNNFVALRCSGNYTVDWGDGSAPVNVSSGVTAEYNYTYSSISSTTNCSRGYRQVIITVTPQAGQNLTSVNLTGFIHSSQQQNIASNQPWLDIIASLPNATTTTFGSSTASSLRLVERISILSANTTSMFSLFNGCSSLVTAYYKTSGTVTDARSVFQSCRNLRSATLDVTVSAGCDGGNTFNGCTSLRKSPSWNFGTTGYFWNLGSHFSGCSNLQEVFPYPTASTSDFSSMFANCISLIAAPEMTTTSATTMSSMFSGCNSLKTVPFYDTNGVTNMSNMFNNCYNLESVPEFDFSTLGTNSIGTMFNNCYRLKSLPTSLNSAALSGSIASIFNNCQSLAKLPTFNTTAVTSFSSAFSGCSSLMTVPAYDFTNSTQNSGMPSAAMQEMLGTGMKVTFAISNNQMQKAQLETMFNNLARVTTTQTLTIASNPGSRVFTKSSSTTSGSPDITVNTTTSLVTGMYATATNLGATKSVTFQDAGDTVTLTAHGFAADKPVSFSVITTTTGISTYTTYYVVNPTTDTFQLATTPGGAAIALTNNGTGTILIVYKVLSIVGTTVTLDAPATATGSSQIVTFRDLDVSLATFKGWTVTGS